MGAEQSTASHGLGHRSFAPSGQQQPRRSFFTIHDQFTSIEQVQVALRREGLESSNLILAIDYTKSNEWTGRNSFGGKSLHAVGSSANPYEAAISIVGRTLAAFDEDNLIPVYGFGDVTSKDSAVFSFLPGDEPCQGLDSVLWRYKELTPGVKLAGPTSFAPAIYQTSSWLLPRPLHWLCCMAGLQAMKIVVDSGCQYHILVLVADGQVTRPSDMPAHVLSSQEQATVNAIVAASKLPLSIVMVGVGDGPWDVMNEFDDQLPHRTFDNFQFVNFTDIASRYRSQPHLMEAQFALKALMEVPEQYKCIQRLGMLSQRVTGTLNVRPPLPPPGTALPHSNSLQASYSSANYSQQPSLRRDPSAGASTFAAPSGYDAQGKQHSFAGLPGGQASGSGSQGTSPDMQAGQPRRAGLQPSASGRGLAGVPSTEQLFLCPITQEYMQDPVIAADGYSYEREAIAQWLRTHNTSPMTNARMEHKSLIPNHALRSSILEAMQQQGQAATRG